jgi:hypothetical protein
MMDVMDVMDADGRRSLSSAVENPDQESTDLCLGAVYYNIGAITRRITQPKRKGLVSRFMFQVSGNGSIQKT